MSRSRAIRVTVIVCVLLFFSGYAFGQEPPAEATDQETSDENAVEARGESVFGFIVNAPNLLLDLTAYQSGFGGMIRYPGFAVRALANVSFDTSTNILDGLIGATYVKPMILGRVSPYWGLSAKAGLTRERVGADADNWNETLSITGVVGGLLGAEVFLFDFLSVFAEYELVGTVIHTIIRASIAGTIGAPTTSTNYGFGSGLGNEASLGIVIYVKPVGVNDGRRNEPEEAEPGTP